MAFVYSIVRKNPLAHKTQVQCVLDGSSYASGGVPFTNAQLGVLGNPDSVDAYVTSGEGFSANWVASTGKVKLFKNAAGAGQFTEVAAGDLSTSTILRLDVNANPQSSVIV